MGLSDSRYWNILLHVNNGVSEIDDERFFFAKDGKTNAKNELDATLEALLNEQRFDDNSSACRFPARKRWLEEQLGINDFPHVECKEYDSIVKRLKPKSVTLVFPAAHINSPASMFGHTFLRINSAYNSKLLSYAVNYAADADPSKENAMLFAVKGLFGGYFGKYSLLPYYEKLKEYRDSEQRDIWEYDLDLSSDETLRMVEHIWELNDTHSFYYFFTENCSYNMLWFLEVARPSLHLREYFSYQVIPLETAHAVKSEGIVSGEFYRPSKRTKLLKYEELIQDEHIPLVEALLSKDMQTAELIDSNISKQQKMYVLEASIELLEYRYSKSQIEKEEYLKLFHDLSSSRASLGQGELLDIRTPPNPIRSHRAIRATAGIGSREGNSALFFGIRPAYHDLEDSGYGFLRGTQIEFLDFEASRSNDKTRVEKATILSIVSLAQRSKFFDNLSWRTKFGWDRESLEDSANFLATVGGGLSWGNKAGYVYIMADPMLYFDNGAKAAIGTSIGAVYNGYERGNTNIELTRRFYDHQSQYLFSASQNIRVSQNVQLKLSYDYKERDESLQRTLERDVKLYLNYYF